MVGTSAPRDATRQCHQAIEALRHGHAPKLRSPRRGDERTFAAIWVATRLAMSAGRVPRPRPIFVARLERDLLARQSAYAASGLPRRPGSPSRWRRLALRAGVALALPVLLALIVLLVRGPQQALADMRRLLSYVPRLGFFPISTQPVRVLAEPVVLTRDGITVRVEQVIASADDTRVVMDVKADATTTGDETIAYLLEAGIVLRTEGAEIPLSEWAQSPDGLVLTFAPLPGEADSAVLTLRMPPSLPTDGGRGEWALQLPLRAGVDASEEMDLHARFVESYEPAVPAQTQHGFTLEVLSVAHTAEETVVRVSIEGYPRTELGVPLHVGGRFLPTLHDDAGRSYAARSAPGVGFEAGAVAAPIPREAPVTAPTTTEQVLAFEPLHPMAQELTLIVDGVAAEVPAQGELCVDVGDAPQIGDAFPMDVELHVAGATLRLTQAALVREEPEVQDGVLARTLLRFDARQVTPTDQVIVDSLTLMGEPEVVRGSSSHGGPEGIRDVAIEFVDGRIPTGALTLRLRSAGVTFLGPWEFTWPVPAQARP